jgi:hypothetical protein
MDYTEQQKAEFKALFARRRRNQIAVAGPVVALMVLIVLTYELSGTTLLGVPMTVASTIAVVALVVVLLFSFRNWRCPACDHYLGRGFNPHFCPRCGAPLQ